MCTSNLPWTASISLLELRECPWSIQEAGNSSCSFGQHT
uniref:Uncharacterized protein n=1 Tax=Arundo donax TaxID=35708 RepID=A0A0A9ENU9_ARUDO